MIPLIIFPDWYRILTNPTADDAWRIGLIISLLIFGFFMALVSDKIDDINDKKKLKNTVLKPFVVQEQTENEFMFTIGHYK